jgi:hypothetical protein
VSEDLRALIARRRLTLGRLTVYLEPRDAWIGAYIDPKAIYICPLPFVVLRWDRRCVDLGARRLPPVAPVGCDDCAAETGELHHTSCRQVPPDWYTRRTVTRNAWPT